MASVEQTISNFLAKQGLNNVAIAGVLGNLQVESNFNPNAYNSNEGAIGIAQWEGGRRVALDAYAKQMSEPSTSLAAQLSFLWHELTERGLKDKLNAASSAQDAAYIFASGFEGNNPVSDSTREADAESIYTGKTIVPRASDYTGPTSAPSTSSSSSGGQRYVNAAALTSTSATDSAATSVQDVGLLQDIKGLSWLSPDALLFDPFNYLKNIGSGITDTTQALTAISNVMAYIAEGFKAWIWLLNPSHFIRFCMYVGGIGLVIFGLYMIIKGAGDNGGVVSD